MTGAEICRNVAEIRRKIEGKNPYGEKVLLVAATKMQTADTVNYAIQAGVDAVAENKPQEFRDKNELLLPCPRHFIGHLQTNKIKYLMGKIELYHSCDRDELAFELARQATKKGLIAHVLLQINIGDEESKGGYAYERAKETFFRLQKLEGLKIRGFMAMLPDSKDEGLLRGLVQKMRRLYDWSREQAADIDYLSMGMSGDYLLCVEEGSNVVRVGSTIFGARTYGG